MKKYFYYTLLGLITTFLVGSTVALANTGNGFGFFGKGQVPEKIAEVLGVTADELKAQLEDKTLPELFDEKGVTHSQLYKMKQEQRFEHQAEMLDMPVDELKKELENKTFAQLLDEKGISHTELMTKRQEQMKAHMTDRLQQMVDQGKITQEQMQEKLQWLEEHKTAGKYFGGFHGGMFKHGF